MVTEYMIRYIHENQISIRQISEKTGISEEKLKSGYKEPLLADEFLELCVALDLRPEKIASALWKERSE